MKTLSILLLSGMTLLGGQSETARMLLDTKLPSVYIRYERQGKRTPVHSGESQEGVWLRLRNNTSGAISLCTESAYIGPNTVPLKLASGKGILGLKDGIEASVCYNVEAPEKKTVPTARGTLVAGQWNPFHQLPLGYHGDVIATSWIPTGGSILLSLPKEHLADQNRISVAFNYEWETERSSGIAHVVYFYASDLPKR
jgi:hypothetical protein